MTSLAHGLLLSVFLWLPETLAQQPPECSANAACAQLGLSGNCCPSDSGDNLDCCSSVTPAPTNNGDAPATAEASLGAGPGQQEDGTRSSGHRQCLLWNGNGCDSIRDQKLCTHSRDGRPWEMENGRVVQGISCVWCGGKECEANKSNLCVGYERLLGNIGATLDEKIAKAEFTVAGCTEKETIVDTAAKLAMPKGGSVQTQLVAVDGGTNKACRGHLEMDKGYQPAIPRWGAGKAYSIWTAMTLEDCKAHCAKDCTGIEFHKESLYCEVWHQPIKHSAFMDGYECYQVANIESVLEDLWPYSELTEQEASCLQPWKGGCSSIEQKLNCLSSKDDGPIDTILGLKVKGQPCVWCADGPCTQNSKSQCGAYDYLHHGEGKAFSILQGRSSLLVASCRSDENTLGAGPDAAPDEEDSKCLAEQISGCNSITSEQQCLSSKDGRSIATVAGLKIHGEPCVWCGGGPCSTNNNNLCEPFQFAVYGEKHAFRTFLAQGTYKVAACNSNGQSESHVLQVDQGTGKVVDTGVAGAVTNNLPTEAPKQQQAGTTPEDKALAAGAAAGSAAASSGLPPKDQALAAGSAAADAAISSSMTGQDQAALAGASAAAVSEAAGMATQEQVALAGDAAAAAANNAGMTPHDQSSAASAAAISVAKDIGLNPQAQASAAGEAAVAAAVAEKHASMTGQEQAVASGAAAAATAKSAGLAPKEQAAAAGAAAASTAKDAGMTAQEQIAAASKAAVAAAKDAGMTTTDQVAAAGAAAAAAGAAAGLSLADQAAVAGAAATAVAKDLGQPLEQQVAAAKAAAAAAQVAVADVPPADISSGTAPLGTSASQLEKTDLAVLTKNGSGDAFADALHSGAATAKAAEESGMTAEQAAAAAGTAAANTAVADGADAQQQIAAAGGAAAAAAALSHADTDLQTEVAGKASANAAAMADMDQTAQAAAAGAAASAVAKAEGEMPADQATAAGEAATKAASKADMAPFSQTAAAGSAALAAGKVAGMSSAEQVQAAGVAAAAAARANGMSPEEQAAAAGQAAAAAAKAASETPSDQAAAAGVAASLARKQVNGSAVEQAVAAGAAAARAAEAAGMTPKEQAAAAGVAAQAAARAAGMNPQEQSAAAGAAAASAAKSAGMTPDEQVALAGEAASKAAKAAGMSDEEQTAAADLARQRAGDLTVRSREIDDGAQDIQSQEAPDAAKKDDEDSQPSPWWMWALVVLAVVLACGGGLCFYERFKHKDAPTTVSRKADLNHREVQRVDDADVELQAPLVGGGLPTRDIGDYSGVERILPGPPAPDAATALFNSLDTDGDGVISQAEWQRAAASLNPQFQPAAAGLTIPQGGTTTRVMTSYPGAVSTASVGAPMAMPMTQVANNSTFVTGQPVVARTLAAPAYTVGPTIVQASPRYQAATSPQYQYQAAPQANQLFNQIDLDHDGRISPNEWQVHQQFTAFDRNHDGIITRAEWEQGARSAVPNRELMEPVAR